VFKRNALETVDIGIGVVGFFAFAFLVVTIVAELTGGDALGWALTLLGLVAAFCLLLVARRRVVASQQSVEPPSPTALE
jgi:Na+/melibiose symporter-like transporter